VARGAAKEPPPSRSPPKKEGPPHPPHPTHPGWPFGAPPPPPHPRRFGAWRPSGMPPPPRSIHGSVVGAGGALKLAPETPAKAVGRPQARKASKLYVLKLFSKSIRSSSQICGLRISPVMAFSRGTNYPRDVGALGGPGRSLLGSIGGELAVRSVSPTCTIQRQAVDCPANVAGKKVTTKRQKQLAI